MARDTHGRARRRASPLMWLTLASGIGFIILLAVFLVQQGASESVPGSIEGPRIAVDQERIDLGRVAFDKSVRAVFTIKNVGNKPLTISERQIATKLVEGC